MLQEFAIEVHAHLQIVVMLQFVIMMVFIVFTFADYKSNSTFLFMHAVSGTLFASFHASNYIFFVFARCEYLFLFTTDY